MYVYIKCEANFDVNLILEACMLKFTGAEKSFFESQGYWVGRGLSSTLEVAEIRNHFMQQRAEGPKPGDMGGDKTKGERDPLNLYARMINMHRWDERTNVWQHDDRFTKIAAHLIGDEVVALQTML